MSLSDPLPERKSWLDPGDRFVGEEELDTEDVVCGNCPNYSKYQHCDDYGRCSVVVPMWVDPDDHGVSTNSDASDCSLFKNKRNKHGT